MKPAAGSENHDGSTAITEMHLRMDKCQVVLLFIVSAFNAINIKIILHTELNTSP